MSAKQTLVDTAIIPMSGYGTRMLPIGKAIEKCMLPIWNRPVLDYVLDELEAAGIARLIFVINSDARTIQQYFGTAKALEKYLTYRGKTDLLKLVQSTRRNFAIDYVVSDDLEKYGTANVVWQALHERPDIPEHFAVIMGDNFCYRPDGSDLLDLITAMQAGGYHHGTLGAVVADSDVSKYGIFAYDHDSCVTKVHEKPQPAEVASRLANISHYIFSKSDIYPLLRAYIAEPRQGEYMITDVLNELALQRKILVQPITGEYFDAGNPQDMFRCWQRLAPKFTQ